MTFTAGCGILGDSVEQREMMMDNDQRFVVSDKESYISSTVLPLENIYMEIHGCIAKNAGG